MSHERLRMGTKLSYGVGSIGEYAIYIAFNNWNFLFYNQVLGLSGTLAALAVTISLVVDAVTDPIVGSISDRLRSKLGRRHPFLYAAPIPLAVSFYLLYCPPASLTGISLFLWFTVFAIFHRVAMTFYSVPHLALGSELSSDYHERSVVMSYGTLFGVIGGAGVTFLGWDWFSKVPGGTTVRDGYPVLALWAGLISALAIFVSAYFTRDQIPRITQNLPPVGTERHGLAELWTEIKGCMSNRNYRMLLLGLVTLSASIGTRETLTSYSSLYFWELPPQKIKVFGLLTPLAYFLAFFVTVWLHRRFDKRNTIVFSTTLLGISMLTPVVLRLVDLAPANGSPALMPFLMLFVFGFYLAVAILMISALSALADIADEHELNTGLRQEGVFYAARTFFAKMSNGLGHVIAGVAIDLIHFPTGAKPGAVAHDVVFKLGLVDGPLAALPAFASIIFYGAYRINRSRHLEIQRDLAVRRASAVPPVATTESVPPGLIQPEHARS
ncbi:MAG TPA: MFS transporter [Polyangiales bacterium]|nr:MFS transporter [Polyangiales bacterium]